MRGTSSVGLQKLAVGRVVEHLRQAAVLVDPTTHEIALWNTAAEQLFGYSAQEALGRLLPELILPGSVHETFRELLAQYRQEDDDDDVPEARRATPLTVRTRAGAELDGHVSLVALEGQASHDRPAVLVLIEPVAEPAHDRQTRESQAEAVEHVPDAVFVRDLAHGVILSWNPGAQALYGWTSDEAVGRVAHELLRTEFSEPREKIESDLNRTGRWTGELVHWTRGGQRVEVASQWIVQHDDRGAPTGFLEINTDITRRKAADLALQREREFSRGLIDSSSDGIMAFDLEYRYTLWNPAMARLTGLPQEVVLGRCAFEVFAFLREIGQDQYFAQALAGHSVAAPDRPYHVPETGHTGMFEARYAPLRDNSGAIVGGLGIIRDVTERHRAEAERLELAREQAARAHAEVLLQEREHMLTTVSHDLKAPLTTIRGQAQLLARHASRSGGFEMDRTAKGLELIEAATLRMTAWIDELLDTARLQGGRPLELNRKPADLIALAWQVAAEHQQTTARHRIRVLTTEAKLVGVWDAARLSRVLDNLVANAVKFSPAGGDVTVEVELDQERSGSWATLRVRDQGVGIPEKDQPQIFERFQRATNVVGRIAGTGIGLAGALQIVEQHGGTIEVSSREGAGSTFSVHLPLLPA
jgi:PAS domain S-box-containing protein